MRESNIKMILEEALLYGNHSIHCAYEVTKRKGRYLPAGHPKRCLTLLDLGQCNCWKKKATRLLRALGSVSR